MSASRVRQHQRFASERQPASSRDGGVHWRALSDTSRASMALNGRCSVSRTAHFLLTVISFGASSIPPLQRICSCLPEDLGKACAHSFFLTFASRGHRATLPPTCGFMISARIASRPRFELGLSSRAPQVSAKRVRLSCSLKSQVFSSIHYSTLACPRHTCRHHPCTLNSLHLYWVEQRLFERCETDHCVVTYAKSVTRTLHGNVDHYQLFGANSTRSSHSNVRENTCRST